MTPTSLPFIGVVMCGFMDQRQFVTHSYISAIVRSGGCPIVLPCTGKKEASLQAASICHGFLFCGGGDVTPLLFDRPPLSSAGETDFQTDLFQLSLMKHVLTLSRPILGICRGMQLMNIVRGGEILQDLSLHSEPCLCHMQHSRLRSDPCHSIALHKDSILYNILGNYVEVNSFHHQAVLTAGKGISITAHSPDGIAEGIELTGRPFVVGVQWHPECMMNSAKMRRLFRSFISAASRGI